MINEGLLEYGLAGIIISGRSATPVRANICLKDPVGTIFPKRL